MLFKLILFISSLFFFSELLASERQTAVLETPMGRFQESAPPIFFKWSLFSKDSTSITLKLFRRKPDGTYHKITDLIARFELPRQVHSLPWSQDPLPPANYVWTIEGYNEVNAKPLFREEAEFVVEDYTYIDLRTRQVGVLLGFGRGQYFSADPNYSVDFKTAPTIYGLLFRGGTEDRLWDFSAVITDFTLRGSANQTISTSAAYSYRINESSASQVDFFVGPLLRSITFRRTHTTDGVTLASNDVTQVSSGIVFTVQKCLESKMTLYAQAKLSVPFWSSMTMASERSSQYAYDLAGGLIFGQYWPLAFGAKILYDVNKFNLMEGSDATKISTKSLSFVPNVSYTF